MQEMELHQQRPHYVSESVMTLRIPGNFYLDPMVRRTIFSFLLSSLRADSRAYPRVC